MVRILESVRIRISKSEVCRYLGYRRGRGLPAPVSKVIDEQIAEGYKLIDPTCSYIIKDIKCIEGPQVIIDDSLVFTSPTLAQILSQCSQVAIFLATIGNHLEARVSQLMSKGEMLKAAVLDTVGSEAVEKVACYIEETIRKAASINGAGISLRYSPGYCDWDISDQRMIFQAMRPASPAVHLTEEFLMIPRKSISGIIGVARFGSNTINYSPCSVCNQHDCLSRR
jgi:hypothetical protein